MNKRIRALAKEAGLWRQHYDIGEESPERLEKFAELIVQECLSYAKDGDLDFMKFMIKKNFGVEQ
jgi:hypothetical protein